MRIIDVLFRGGIGIEHRLGRFAAGNDAAKKWRALKMLELLQQLPGEGDDIEVYGSVWGEELCLSPTNSADHISVSVSADWYDYAPLYEGKPDMHYRLRVREAGQVGAEARARTAAEVERFVREAFGA